MSSPFHAYMRKEAANYAGLAKQTADYAASKIDAAKFEARVDKNNVALAKRPGSVAAIPTGTQTDTSRAAQTAKPAAKPQGAVDKIKGNRAELAEALAEGTEKEKKL